MQKVNIGDDISLEYEASGHGEPVVFIHGALLARPFKPLLAERGLSGYRLIEYQRRGYGGSSAAAGVLTVSEQAEDCRSLLRAIGVTRAHVVGHSFGGAVALQMALDEPSLVHTLALLEPALMIGETGPQYRQTLEQGISRYREVDPAALLDGFMEARWPGYRKPLEAALPGAFDQAISDAATTFEVELPGLLQWSFDSEAAGRITPPCLSVLGAESERLWSRFGEVHRWLLAHLPIAQAATIPGAHHMMMLENPAGLADILGAFFRDNPIPA